MMYSFINGATRIYLACGATDFRKQIPGKVPENYDFESHKKFVPMQAGDVPVTYADTATLEREFGYKPTHKSAIYKDG